MKNIYFDLRENLISTRMSASHSKSTQAHADPGQMESQVDPEFQLASTCESVWAGSACACVDLR